MALDRPQNLPAGGIEILGAAATIDYANIVDCVAGIRGELTSIARGGGIDLTKSLDNALITPVLVLSHSTVRRCTTTFGIAPYGGEAAGGGELRTLAPVTVHT